ncbi:MAG: prolyl oligopeptidase family serine peptidase [Longimicrobiales bacterium]
MRHATALRQRIAVVLGAIALAGVAAATRPSPAQAQQYADRSIDVAKYVDSHRVVGYNLKADVPGLYARVRTQGAIQVRFFDEATLASDTPIDIDKGTHLYPWLDFSKRFANIGRRDPLTGDDIVFADTANDEHFDLFLASNGGRELKRLTASGRIQNYFPHGGRVAYVEEVGTREPYSSCMRLVNTGTGVTTTIACAGSFAGYSPMVTWRPDGRAFVSSRRLFHIVGDTAMPRESVPLGAPLGWRDSTAYRYITAVGGVRNVVEYEIAAAKTVPVTTFPTNYALRGDVRNIAGRQVILADSGARRLLAFDMMTSKRIGSTTLPAGTVAGASGAFTLLSFDSATAPRRHALLRSKFVGDSLSFDVKELPYNTDAPQTCNVEQITYKSFDRDVNALLFTPRNPLPRVNDRLAVVVAYYGGGSTYDYNIALWCEAGISTLSPDINRNTYGDRGGNEIADGLYAARWLQGRLGLQETQVGTYGTSQGGFNALRLMTFQPQTNNRNVTFDFGFAIAEAGYSSQLTILKHTNTESPSIIATGNPDTDEGRRTLMDRSPLNQIDRLNAPVLLIHGTSDHRVQIEESWQFVEAARRAGKDVTLLEMPGEGHGVMGERNLKRYYEAQLTFLEKIRRSRASQ